jgi:hypothetical protein
MTKPGRLSRSGPGGEVVGIVWAYAVVTSSLRIPWRLRARSRIGIAIGIVEDRTGDMRENLVMRERSVKREPSGRAAPMCYESALRC